MSTVIKLFLKDREYFLKECEFGGVYVVQWQFECFINTSAVYAA